MNQVLLRQFAEIALYHAGNEPSEASELAKEAVWTALSHPEIQAVECDAFGLIAFRAFVHGIQKQGGDALFTAAAASVVRMNVECGWGVEDRLWDDPLYSKPQHHVRVLTAIGIIALAWQLFARPDGIRLS